MLFFSLCWMNWRRFSSNLSLDLKGSAASRDFGMISGVNFLSLRVTFW